MYKETYLADDLRGLRLGGPISFTRYSICRHLGYITTWWMASLLGVCLRGRDHMGR
jgi:hypothetical protein